MLSRTTLNKTKATYLLDSEQAIHQLERVGLQCSTENLGVILHFEVVL